MKATFRIASGTYEFIELEGTEEDIPRMLKLQNQYSEKPVQFKAGTTIRKKDMFGNEIDWDESTHTYSWNGEKYLSGSEYAKSKQKPFDPVMMSGMVAKKYGADPKEIAALWERGGKVSRDFGLTVHEALEVYGKFKSLSDSVEKEYHVPTHPVLKDIVEGFYKGREDETAVYEVLVVDHKNKRAGTIDRLVLHGPKICTIQDFKITHKESLEYWEDQLSFYEGILIENGMKVRSKEIYQYNENWKKVKL